MILEGRDQGKQTKQEETCSRKINQFSSLAELHTLTSEYQFQAPRAISLSLSTGEET